MRTYLSLALLAGILSLTACGDHDRDNDGDKGSKSASQASGSDSQKSKAEDLVKGSSKGKAKLLSTFKGPDQMVGLVVEMEGGQKQVVFGSPGLDVLFPAGISSKGDSINEAALTEQNVYASASKLADGVGGKGFIVGSSGPIVTAFMDPNCVFCNKFYNEIMPSVKSGKLRVRFLMSGFLKPTSIPRSVAILAAKDPAKALEQDERGFDQAHEEGGIAPLKETRNDLEAEVAANTALMASGGPVATPAILACQKGVGATYLRGSPQDIPAFLAALDTSPTIESCKNP
jgi:thiol:disulfide interchange protein DsbG